MDECTFHILYRIKPYPLIIPLNYPHPPPHPTTADNAKLSWEIRTCQRILRGKTCTLCSLDTLQYNGNVVLVLYHNSRLLLKLNPFKYMSCAYAQIQKYFHRLGGGGLKKIFVSRPIFNNLKMNGLNFPGEGGGVTFLTTFQIPAYDLCKCV